MKSCKEFENELYFYADRQERKSLPADLLEHVQACDRCGKLYASLRQVEAAIVQGGDAPMPPESYFEALPKKILSELPAEKNAPEGGAIFPGLAAWLSSLFSRPLAKTAFALAILSIVAIAVWQSLPEGAQITFVDNTGRMKKSEPETPAENVLSSQAQTATEPEADKLAEMQATIPKADALKTAYASKPQKAEEGDIEPEPDSALSQLAQAEIKFNQGLAIRQNEPEPAAELALRTVPPPVAPENLKMAEAAARQAEINAMAAAEFKETEKERDDLSGRSKRTRGKASGVPATAQKSRSMFMGRQRKVAFADYLRVAQSASSDQERVRIWRRFLASTQDSTQYALGLEQLAGAIKANADQSREVSEIADAIVWFEENEPTLKPLMGEVEYDNQLIELRARLQQARTGRLKQQ